MKRISVFCILLLLVPVVYGQTGTINLSGTVKDGKGGAIAGATVTLASDSLMNDTTDSNGEFLISNMTAVGRDRSSGLLQPRIGSIRVKGNLLRFSSAEPANNASVVIYSGNGRKIVELNYGKMDAGIQTFVLPVLAPGYYVIHLLVDRSVTRCKLIATGSDLYLSRTVTGANGSSRISRTHATAEQSDTLIVKKEGYRMARKAITSLTQTEIAIVTDTLSERNRNLFAEVLGKTEEEIDAKLNTGFQQLFYGDRDTETIYYEGGPGAYILDVNNGDVRSEGQSYGMMICVQMDKKKEFDKIWAWTKQIMGGGSASTFQWTARAPSGPASQGSAPDGEEYIATALIFAGKRWDENSYTQEGKSVLGATKGFFSQNLVQFIPGCGYNDPSYVLPAFYEAWAAVDVANQAFWKGAASTGREFFHKTCNQTTMLAPYKANFSGSGYGSEGFFNTDAWRVVGNIMMDWNLCGVDKWQKESFAPKYAAFMKVEMEKAPDVPYKFELNGTVLGTVNGKAKGLVAQNALVGFGLPVEDAKYFVQELWDMVIPVGQYRYYDGCLYLLALLHLSGRFHLYY